MRDWKEENLIDFIKGTEESEALYGDYIRDKAEQTSIEYDIEEIAEKVIQRVDEGFVADFDFSDMSLEALEKVIDDAFKEDDDPYSEVLEDLIFDLGSYLGITIVSSLGGQWRFRSDFIHTSIYFPSIDSECFPFHRVARRLLQGKSESLVEFYDSLIGIFELND